MLLVDMLLKKQCTIINYNTIILIVKYLVPMGLLKSYQNTKIKEIKDKTTSISGLFKKTNFDAIL